MTLLGIDLETTGLHESANILTSYFGVLDNNFKVIQSLDLKLKPDINKDERGGRSIYSIQVEAMNVNKIDLLDHDSVAISYKEAKPIVYKWLEEMRSLYGELTPFGNMVRGDISKICECLLSRGSWDNFCDRRIIELSSLGKTLQLLGKIPETQSLSLSQISKYFGLQVDEDLLHTAKYDVEVGVFVLKKYMELMS
jgi:hypothetical protein